MERVHHWCANKHEFGSALWSGRVGAFTPVSRPRIHASVPWVGVCQTPHCSRPAVSRGPSR
eukprot:3815985-Rhodomonas_salina.1